MSQLVIVADDLTGAADTGACFADAGLTTVIPRSQGMIPNADVIVLSTESRDLKPESAVRAVKRALADLTDARTRVGPRWVYKKIDSALRGYPREELLAVMTAMGVTRTVVAPAFPAEGRTTIGGHQHVHGVPLELSRFAGPGTTSDLEALFTTAHGPPTHHLDLKTIRGDQDELQHLLDKQYEGIVIADAETDEDLFALACATSDSKFRLLCGAAGFAQQLSGTLPLMPAGVRSLELAPGAGPILVVAGSQHETTARQILTLREQGFPIVSLHQNLIDDPAASIEATVVEVAAHLVAGRSMVLTSVGLAACPGGGHAVATRLAQVVAAPLVSNLIGGLVLTGGDVAAEVCTALNVSALWLKGEILPGLPWGVLEGGTLHARPVSTKAGSFGKDDALLACIEHLTSEAVSRSTRPNQVSRSSGPLHRPRDASR